MIRAWTRSKTRLISNFIETFFRRPLWPGFWLQKLTIVGAVAAFIASKDFKVDLSSDLIFAAFSFIPDQLGYGQHQALVKIRNWSTILSQTIPTGA